MACTVTDMFYHINKMIYTKEGRHSLLHHEDIVEGTHYIGAQREFLNLVS
jgi:hypothetical protein